MTSGGTGTATPRERRRRRRLWVNFSVFLLLLGVIMLIAAVKLWQPVSTGRRQQEELARLRDEKARLQAEHDQLEAYKHDLASDKGREATLRRQGYAKPGERRLEFIDKEGAGKKGK